MVVMVNYELSSSSLIRHTNCCFLYLYESADGKKLKNVLYSLFKLNLKLKAKTTKTIDFFGIVI
jgi:hypothetical protein